MSNWRQAGIVLAITLFIQAIIPMLLLTFGKHKDYLLAAICLGQAGIYAGLFMVFWSLPYAFIGLDISMLVLVIMQGLLIWVLWHERHK